ncbi:MAG: hypothetical protein V4754_01095 [Pseudomonadota bacterium]
MTPTSKLALTMLTCAVLALSGCKRQAKPVASVPATSAHGLEETQVVATPTAVKQPEFDVHNVQLSVVPLPPFPYIGMPAVESEDKITHIKANFDRKYFLAGNKLIAVEGRSETRRVHRNDTKMSDLEIRRNYQNLLKTLGAVRVAAVNSTDENFPTKAGAPVVDVWSKLDLQQLPGDYEAYVLRTPEKTIWFGFGFGIYTEVQVLEEQAMKQSIGLIKAESSDPPAIYIKPPAVAH